MYCEMQHYNEFYKWQFKKIERATYILTIISQFKKKHVAVNKVQVQKSKLP